MNELFKGKKPSSVPLKINLKTKFATFLMVCSLFQLQAKESSVEKIIKTLDFDTSVTKKGEVIKKQINENDSEVQKHTITGVVKDQYGGTLPGANIVEKGTSNGTQSDFDGKFSLDLENQNTTIVISFLGYSTQEVSISGQSTVEVILKEDAAQLDDVVVIGYGTAKKTDLTGSISTVSSKDFKNQPITRAEDVLQSRAAGVSVIKNSGAPGSDVKIRVRGSGSINGSNAPLIVIDGIVGGNLRSLNTNDIESINVLKDASASAIYGSRASNGVVLVTTKKGSGKPKINFDYFVSSSKVPSKLDLLSPAEYSSRYGTTIVNGGADYQDEFFDTALTNNVQLSISGSEGKIRYYISGNLVDQEGVVINTDYQRYSLRSNLNADLSDKFSVGLRVFSSREKSHNLVASGDRTSSDIRGGLANVLTYDPSSGILDANGNYNLTSENGFLINPIAVQKERDGNIIEDRFNTNLDLTYKFNENLKFTVLGGASISHFNEELFQGVPAGSAVVPPSASFNSIRTSDFQLSNILNWKKEFENASLNVTGIYELQSSTSRRANLNSRGFTLSDLSEAFYLLELGGIQTVGADLLKSDLRSYVARAEFNLADMLSLTGTIRIDESSRFRKGNRTGYFPSIAAAYSLKQFISEDSFIDNIKLRAGYGEAGNQDIPSFSTFSRFPTGVDFFFNGSSFNVGLGNSPLIDEDLTWETSKQFNAGIDFRMAKGRLNLSLDWYNKITDDLLLDLPVAGFNGGGFLRTNAGKIENKGIDASLTAIVFDNKDFRWDATLTMSAIKNKIKDLGGLDRVTISPFPSGGVGTVYALEEGESLGNFYGLNFLGTDTSGNATYGPELGVIGNGLPDFTWGLNNNFTWKQFDLNVLLRGVHGYEILNGVRAAISDPGLGTSRDVLTSDVTGNDVTVSTRYIEDGSFIRLSNLTVGYTLPEIKGVKSLKIYLSGQNLFTITDYRGYDPEVSSLQNAGGDATPSYDNGALPNPRTFTLGCNLSF